MSRNADRHASRILPWACVLLTVLWLVSGVSLLGSTSHVAPGARRVVDASPARRVFEQDLDSLANNLAHLDTALTASRLDDARAAYRSSRLAYKRVEALLAYYSPTTVAILNGPAEEGSVDDAPQPLGRQGAFQTIEAAVADSNQLDHDLNGARQAAQSMRRSLSAFRTATALLDVSDTAALDAARLELARATTLGLAGFDLNEPGSAILESAESLEGLRATLVALQFTQRDERTLAAARAIDGTLSAAIRELRGDPNFERLDRLRFISRFATPAANAILAARRLVDPAEVHARRSWRPSSASPFSRGAFDASAYAPEYAPTPSEALLALGKRLFNDVNLSGPRTRACASCHVEGRGFTDGLRHQAPLTAGPNHASSPTLRNTPTLWNVALQPFLFADQRAGYLEDQVGAVLASAGEMGSSGALAAERVQSDTSYRSLLAPVSVATPSGSTAMATERTIRIALAVYLRSLVGLNSRFDRAVQGDSSAMSESERRGFTLFMGKAHCGNCHFAPLFNGVMPPDFVRSELEIIGVPGTDAARGALVDDDSGRAHVDGLGVHAHAFKVPTLRNVALTAPYMHNGVFATLEAVVDFYNRGGGTGIGERLPAQTLSPRRLGLTVDERRDLVAFLKALTDSSAFARSSFAAR
ncbi:MAG TPA: cytochrome c peroxidase [Gemmatimonadaceae bacterium]|nr:cytochrome c peroxidase [Gemmatimonadaceae bacterium]